MSEISTPIMLRELAAEELPLLFPLIAEHNPSMTRAMFDARLQRMVPLGYRAIGLFDGPHLIGCSGFWLRTRFWDGNELDIDNFFVKPEYRSQKLGARMLAWFEAFALEHAIDLIVLDTYADSFEAQRFYLTNGYSLTGYHITKIPGTRAPFQKQKN